MIAGLFPPPHFLVDARRLQPACQRRAEQEMVDPQPRIPAIGIAEIVPEGIDLFIGVEFPDGIGPALCYKGGKGLAGLGRKRASPVQLSGL